MTEELHVDDVTPPHRPARRAERQLRRLGSGALISYEDQTRLLHAILDVCGYIFDHTDANIAALSAELQWYDQGKVVDGIRSLYTVGRLSRVKRGGGKVRRWQVGG